MFKGMGLRRILVSTIFLVSAQAIGAPVVYIYTDNTVVPPVTSFGNLLEGDTILDTYYGSVVYSKMCSSLPINISCNYAIEARISQAFESPPYQNIDISIGAIRMMNGGAFCDSLEFRGLEWEGQLPHASLPISPFSTSVASFPLGTIEVEGPCGICSGTLSGSWTNAGTGTIGVSGSLPYIGGGSPGACSVSGSFTQIFGSIYGIWH